MTTGYMYLLWNDYFSDFLDDGIYIVNGDVPINSLLVGNGDNTISSSVEADIFWTFNPTSTGLDNLSVYYSSDVII
jgi:hypothetical protein